MAFEIELKAWADNPEELKKRLSELGVYCYSYEKDDVYWTFPGAVADHVFISNQFKLRIRREIKTDLKGQRSSAALVTYKTREIRGGIEVNDERELEISDGNIFEDILKQLGLTPGVRKEKRGTAWKCDQDGPILAELSEVKSLGHFIELEILSAVCDEADLEENRSRLLVLLEKLDIPPEKIETRPYTQMLI
jgi:adenylate cyclase class 2